MRRLASRAAATLLAALLVPSTLPVHAAGIPAFVPRSSAIYDGFVAINGPRADVPVGALWIDGYGPHGEGAAADNLEVVRGLSGITINRDLELRLTAGLLDLLGIDPALRKQFQARFTEISIVRVKEVARLSGPAGEPRIIEAMKAGSVIVTTDSDIGLDLNHPALSGPVFGRLDSGRKRGFAIEGRDMFIAMRVAAPLPSRGRPELIRLWRAGDLLVGAASGLAVEVRLQPCAAGPVSDCQSSFAWRVRKEPAPIDEEVSFSPEPKLQLPIPRGDGQSGLYTSAELRVTPPCKHRKTQGCGGGWRAWLTLVGDRIEDVPNPRAPRW